MKTEHMKHGKNRIITEKLTICDESTDVKCTLRANGDIVVSFQPEKLTKIILKHQNLSFTK